jgi:prevent-host-death family protein
MDQRIDAHTPAELDGIMDTVVRDDTYRVVRRGGKPAVVVMSLGEYYRLRPAPSWLVDSWDSAKATGLDAMTMDEINDEIDACHRDKNPGIAEPR